MASGSTSGFEAEARELSNSQSMPALAYASSAHEGPVFSGKILEPTEPLRRTKSEHDVHQTRHSSRRLRRQPVDPTLEQVSSTPGGPPHPEGESPQYDVEEVLRKVLPRTEGTIKYPEFDAAGAYAESDDAVVKMWHDETRRLMEIANNPEMPLEFQSNGFFQGDTEKGYSDVSKLSQKILIANAICLLDNKCVNAEHCGRLSSQQKLHSLIEQVNKSQRATVTTVGLDDVGAQQQELHSPSLAATYSLVDYISAVLTRLITETSLLRDWHADVMSILIRRVTKIKLLLLDLEANSALAVTAGQDILSKIPETGSAQHAGDGIDEEEACEEYLHMLENNEKEGIASYEEQKVAAHCIDQNKYRIGLNSAFRDILMSVRFLNRPSCGVRAAEFEICALMYKTYLEGLRALLYQDRNLEYSATSSLDNMETAYWAFKILYRIVTRLDESREQGACTGSMGTKLRWRYEGAPSSRYPYGYLQLNSMDQVITALIPLATLNPAFLDNFTCFRRVIAYNWVIRDDMECAIDRFAGAFFHLHTSQFDDTVYAGLLDDDNARKRGILRLAQAERNSLFLPYTRSRLKKVNGFFSPFIMVYFRNKPFDHLNKLMNGWVVDEMSVTVYCPGYVWGVIAVASLLVGSGLGIGFSVGERIHGVDPSNLATYLWVVAAFVVLIAKNTQVTEWTWNDFLRRRVRCCSVSELSSMTSVNEQLIISKLLHDERRGSVLNVRGPYNSAFLRRSNEGFSIDEPTDSSTLLRSGVMMLKVATSRGHALVCLDFRRGTDLSVIGHTPDPQKEYLICEQIENFQLGFVEGLEESQTLAKHAFSRSRGLKWKRVLGIYNFERAQFI